MPATTQAAADLGPGVTVHLQDAAPAQALAEFARVAQLSFADPAPGFWTEGDAPVASVSFDLQNQPFWAALSQVQSKLGIGFVADNNGQNITPTHGPGDWGWTGRPEAAIGPVLLSVRQIDRRLTVPYTDPSRAYVQLTIGMRALVQPGSDWTFEANGFEISSLITDQGLDLRAAQKPVMSVNPATPGQGLCNFSAFAPVGLKIASLALTGAVHCVGSATQETIQIDNAETASLDREVVGYHVHLAASRNARAIEERLTCQVPPGMDRASLRSYTQRLSSIWTGRVRMFDANGIEMTSRPGFDRPPFPSFRRRTFTTAPVDHVDLILDFLPADAPPPYKLIWTVPSAMNEISLPFQIKEIPVP